VEPLADVLAVPRLASGPLLVALEQARRVDLRETRGLVALDAFAHESGAEMDPVGNLEILHVGHRRRHAVGQGSDDGEGRGRDEDKPGQRAEAAKG
jgi:hypothetical protein